MKSIIVDDEPRNISILSNFIETYCDDITVVATATNITDAAIAIEKHNPSVVFLDIEMPGGSGFDLIDKLMPIDFEVVFVTAFDNYLLKAFKYAALDYLLKPVDIEELKLAVAKARKKQLQQNTNSQLKFLLENLSPNSKTQNKNIAIPSTTGLDFITVEYIVKIEVSSSYTHIFTNDNKKTIATKTLKEFEELLNPKDFFRINFSTIINLAYIKKYHKGRGGFVEMQNGESIEVATRRKADFLAIFG